MKTYGGRSHTHIYIYSYVFYLYFISLTELTRYKQHAVKYVYIFLRCNIYIYYIYVIGLYLVSSWMCQLSNSFEDKKVLESIPWFSHWIDSHTGLNINLTWNSYFEFRIWDLDFQLAYNIYKPTIGILW